jgi:hypothetical protein
MPEIMRQKTRCDYVALLSCRESLEKSCVRCEVFEQAMTAFRPEAIAKLEEDHRIADNMRDLWKHQGRY